VVDEGLVQYIRQRLGEGYNEEHIREVLQTHGHDPKTVDNAFASLHRERKHLPVLAILLVLLIGAAVIIFFLVKPSPEPNGPGGSDDPSRETIVTPPSQPTTGVVSIAESLSLNAASQTPDETYYATVQAASKSASTVADGILLCSVNKELSYKNYCLIELADQRRNADYCVVIGDVQQRDDCYLKLILKGEDQYCASLRLDENKRVCDILLGNA